MPLIRTSATRSAVVPTARLHALPETAAALASALASGQTSVQHLAHIVILDPVLVLDLLLTFPLAPEEAGSLAEQLANRLQQIEHGLLQAWVLRHILPITPRHTSAQSRHHLNGHSLFVAELSAALARATGYPAPDEARTAGLLHDLGLLWLSEYADGCEDLLSSAPDEAQLSAREWPQGLEHAELAAQLVTRCGLPSSVSDSIALHHATPAALGGAHPLMLLLAAAESLTGEWATPAPAKLEVASQLLGLAPPALQQCMEEAAERVMERTQACPWSVPGTTFSATSLLDGIVTRIALEACAHSVFVRTGWSWPVFSQALRLLLGLDAPVIFVESVDKGMLLCRPAPGQADLRQIRVPADDALSLIVGALRSGQETRYQADRPGPGRSTADWQLARGLNCDGLLCVPWENIHESGVAVFPYPGRTGDDGESARGLRKTLVQAATSRLSASLAEEKMRLNLEERVARRYIEHARRIAHEASNPLTALKNYLSIIDERTTDALLQEQLRLLGEELDRVHGLIRQASNFNGVTRSGPSSSSVAEILRDLCALYGEALFTRQGIRFEIRTPPNLPAAAIAPDTLKQILLNLFKNAAEALPAGGKLTLSAVSGVNTNGKPCLEIRVSDNGPGLSPEQIRTLFTHGNRNSNKPGGGVGLPLVHELVTSNGGTLLCRSQPGAGTAFQIYMPLANPEAALTDYTNSHTPELE